MELIIVGSFGETGVRFSNGPLNINLNSKEIMELNIKASDKVFFDEKGLTSTAANHICNKAKELMKAKQSKLDSIRFYTTKVGLVSSDAQKVMSAGMPFDESFANYEKLIADVANVNAMIAWIKEGIKAKDRVCKWYCNTNTCLYDDFKEETGMTLPKTPERGEYITEETVIGTWDADKRNRYYTLEALCSLLGKYIHPKGAFYEAKQALDKVVANPVKIEGTGRDAMMYEYEATKKQDEVKDAYANMSTILRHQEAELNQMKQTINDEVRDHNSKVDNDYAKDYKEYRTAISDFNNQFYAWVDKKQKIASKLKIWLPKGPKQTYDEVSKA